MYSVPLRKLYIYTGPHIADPVGLNPVTEEFDGHVYIPYVTNWKLRLFLKLLKWLIPPVSEETVQEFREIQQKHGATPLLGRYK